MSDCDDNIVHSCRNDEPHVLVLFRNGIAIEEEIVHYSFVQGFGPSTEDFEKKRLYKVFWSPDDSDSPSEMLKRVSKIPVFEKDAKCSEPGYYRATISALKANKKELEAFVEGKRIPVVPSSCLFSSFDEKQVVCNKKKRSPLQQGVSQLQKKAIKTEPKAVDNQPSTSQISRRPNSTSLKDALLRSRPSLKQCLNEVLPSETTGCSKSAQRQKRNKVLPPDSQSSQDDSNSSDDDFVSPRKFRKLQDDFQREQASLQKVRSLNLRLQEKLKEAEEERDALKAQLLYNNSNPKQLNHLESGSNSCNLSDMCETIFLSPPKIACNQKDKETDQAKCSEVSHMEVSGINEALSSYQSDNDDLSSGDADESKVADLESVDLSNGEKPLHSSSSTLLPRMNADLGLADEQEQVGLAPNGESYVLAKGKILNEKLFKIFKNIKSGYKGDLRLIKNAAVFLFGPETLASSTVYGTSKGQKKSSGDSEQQTKKPALDSSLLLSIKDFLSWRVSEEEAKNVPTAPGPNEKILTKEERLSKKRIENAIRDKQKRLRELGYGEGNKSNTLNEDEFSKEF